MHYCNHQQNCNHKGNCHNKHIENNCGKKTGICSHHHHGNCLAGNKKGNRRRLFEEKFTQYLLENKIPEFQSDEEFEQWLSTTEGQKYNADIEQIWKEIEQTFPWGGKREFAGRRKTCAKKIPFTRRINEDILKILKEYSEKHSITETEALEKAIMLLENI